MLNQQGTLARLQQFLGLQLEPIDVRPESVGRYKQDEGEHDFDFLRQDMIRLGYLTQQEAAS